MASPLPDWSRPCPQGQVRDPLTGMCRPQVRTHVSNTPAPTGAPCPKGYIRDARTGRCKPNIDPGAFPRQQRVVADEAPTRRLVAGEGTGTGCMYDAECKIHDPQAVCRGGVCVTDDGPGPGGGTGCRTDADCPPDHACRTGPLGQRFCAYNPGGGRCQGDTECPGDQICRNGKCVKGCSSHQQCPGGRCNFQTGQCEENRQGCRGDGDCQSPTPFCHTDERGQSQCVECTADGQCGGGNKKCVMFKCVTDEVPPCRTNADCTHLGGSFVCENGQCVNKTAPGCESNADCAHMGPNAECREGQCHAGPRAPGTDVCSQLNPMGKCPDGQRCIGGQCVVACPEGQFWNEYQKRCVAGSGPQPTVTNPTIPTPPTVPTVDPFVPPEVIDPNLPDPNINVDLPDPSGVYNPNFGDPNINVNLPDPTGVYRPNYGDPNINVNLPDPSGVYRPTYRDPSSVYDPSAAMDRAAGLIYQANLPDPEDYRVDAEKLKSDPGYIFRLQQGSQAQAAAINARGMGLSGDAVKGLIAYQQGYASEEFDKAWRREQEKYHQTLDREMKQFGMSIDVYDRAIDREMKKHGISADRWERDVAVERMKYGDSVDAYNRAVDSVMRKYGIDTDNWRRNMDVESRKRLDSIDDYNRVFQSSMAQYGIDADNWSRMTQTERMKYEVSVKDFDRRMQTELTRYGIGVDQFNRTMQTELTKYGISKEGFARALLVHGEQRKDVLAQFGMSMQQWMGMMESVRLQLGMTQQEWERWFRVWEVEQGNRRFVLSAS